MWHTIAASEASPDRQPAVAEHEGRGAERSSSEYERRIADLEKEVARLREKSPVLPLLSRRWVPVALPASPPEKCVTIAHWNILAEHLATTGGFDERTPPALLEWTMRCPRLTAGMKDVDADIVGISEASADNNSAQAYAQKNPRDVHGVSLGWKSHVSAHAILKIEKVVAAIVALLETRGKKFWVVVTHLKAKGDHEEIRMAQMRHLCSIVRGVLTEHPFPVIFMGDFNAPPDAPCMVPLGELGLHQVGGLPWTTWKRRPAEGERKESIDGMWASRHFVVERYLDVPDDDAVTEAGLLPGTRYPSDHLLVATTFSLTK